LDSIFRVAEQFKQQGRIIDIREFGNGNINTTFLVTQDAKLEKHFILQRINSQVFRRPELVVQNMRICTDHMRQRLNRALPGRRWEVLEMLSAQNGQDFWLDADGSFWRAISFIKGSQSFDTIADIEHAREVGCALGIFHTLLSDLPAERLADTLKGFHIMPCYFRHYADVLAKCNVGKSPGINYCLQFIRERNAWAHVLENARMQGILPLRPIHGDPKVSNIMIDTATRQAISIVDLDTVKPGLIHYDIGDCLRSGCNTLGEETEQWQEVYFDLDLCKAILQGYLSMAREFLTENDFFFIYDSIRLIAFELGLRFFTDYLEGNVYFKVRHLEHNLARALVQFNLTRSIELQEETIRSIIREIK